MQMRFGRLLDRISGGFAVIWQGYLSEYGREAARLPVLAANVAIRRTGA